jgi:hypothetical protein
MRKKSPSSGIGDVLWLLISIEPAILLTMHCGGDSEIGRIREEHHKQVTVANAEQLAALKCGLESWNQWRRDNCGKRIDLSHADLRGVDLSLMPSLRQAIPGDERLLLHLLALVISSLTATKLVIPRKKGRKRSWARTRITWIAEPCITSAAAVENTFRTDWAKRTGKGQIHPWMLPIDGQDISRTPLPSWGGRCSNPGVRG